MKVFRCSSAAPTLLQIAKTRLSSAKDEVRHRRPVPACAPLERWFRCKCLSPKHTWLPTRPSVQILKGRCLFDASGSLGERRLAAKCRGTGVYELEVGTGKAAPPALPPLLVALEYWAWRGRVEATVVGMSWPGCNAPVASPPAAQVTFRSYTPGGPVEWADCMCTCPNGKDNPICKHTLALLLARLSREDWVAADGDPAAAEQPAAEAAQAVAAQAAAAQPVPAAAADSGPVAAAVGAALPDGAAPPRKRRALPSALAAGPPPK